MFALQHKFLRIFGSSYKGFFINRLCKGTYSTEPTVASHIMQPLTVTQDKNNLIWIDMEMTGLEPEIHHILEVACVITDKELNIISDKLNFVIHQPEEVLNGMNDWCVKMHKKTGLRQASVESKVTLQEVENKLLNFIRPYAPYGKCPLAGNSVYGDRLFLRKYLPQVDEHIHYRLVDVSSVKELCRRWFPHEYEQAPVKTLVHRALPDILESIEELKYYKDTVFNLHAEPMGKVSWC